MRIIERRVKSGNKGFVIYDLKDKQDGNNTKAVDQKVDEEKALQDGCTQKKDTESLLKSIREKYGIAAENNWMSPLQEIEIPPVKNIPKAIPVIASAYEPNSPNTSISEIIVNEGSFNLDLDRFILEQEEFLEDAASVKSQADNDLEILQAIRNKYLIDESSSVVSFCSSPVKFSEIGSPTKLDTACPSANNLQQVLFQNNTTDPANQKKPISEERQSEPNMFAKTMEKLEADEASYSSVGTATGVTIKEKSDLKAKETREFYCQTEEISAKETQIETNLIDRSTKVKMQLCCNATQTFVEIATQGTQVELTTLDSSTQYELEMKVDNLEFPQALEVGIQTEETEGTEVTERANIDTQTDFENLAIHSESIEIQADTVVQIDANTQCNAVELVNSTCQTVYDTNSVATQKNQSISDFQLNTTTIEESYSTLCPELVLEYGGSNQQMRSLRERYMLNLKKIKDLEWSLSLYYDK
ncbi:hypothetical protein HDV01_006093 [Terramyces sp. JEL0728]|nr:hypothetical protein HDV01_006093 [Terramyces sp. JEL0728]